MKYIFLFFILIILVSCNKKTKSNDLLNKATEVYFLSNLDENIKLDSSLVLTKKAIEIDNENVNALQHLSILLFKQKDINGLLEVNDKLINLLPERASFLLQKGFYLEIKGNSSDAKKYYQLALDKYKSYLKKDSLNFDLYMEYVGALDASNDTILANSILAKMKNIDFENYQKEMIDLYKEQRISKIDLIKYWNGEIKYDELNK